MAHSSDYKGLIRQSSIIIFVILALYLALVRPLAKQGVNLLQGQIEEAVIQLERYISEKDAGILPTEENLKALQTHLAQDEQNYQALKRFIDPEQTYLPEQTQEAGLYFIEQLHITTKRLKRQANTLKIKVPGTFGFGEEMPEGSENVEFLLKELDIVDRVTSLLMEQGVEEISLVKPLTSIEQRDQNTQKLFYRELLFQLSFSCNSASLVKLLYQIKNFSPALVVKEMIIKKAGGLSLQVEMLLSRLVLS